MGLSIQDYSCLYIAPTVHHRYENDVSQRKETSQENCADQTYFESGFGESLAEPRDGGRKNAFVGGREAVMSFTLNLKTRAV